MSVPPDSVHADQRRTQNVQVPCGARPSNLVFLGIMVYASIFSNNFIYNAYAWEGPGVRSYFINPVIAQQVVFGKNVGLWMYNLIIQIAVYRMLLSPAAQLLERRKETLIEALKVPA